MTEVEESTQEAVNSSRLPAILSHPYSGSSLKSSKSTKERKPKCEWDRYRPVDRSDWWKCTIKPNPELGTYDCFPSFIELLDKNPIKQSYRFKSDGRKTDLWKFSCGAELMPGAYNYEDFQALVSKQKLTYGFRNKPRPENALIEGLVDKNLDLSPGLYNVENFMSPNSTKEASKLSMFRSRTKRLPSKEFVGKEGPEAGLYDCKNPSASSISSSFKSSGSRFKMRISKVPGPGTYDSVLHFKSGHPDPERIHKTIASMGRQHGLFFSCSFNP